MDVASMPARLQLSHTRMSSAEPNSFGLLADMDIAANAPGRLSHTLRVGQTQRVFKYIRLLFTGHAHLTGGCSTGAF